MKLTKMTLIGFLLVAILTLGAVSAADDNAASKDTASEIAIDESLQVNADQTGLQDDLQATETNENLEISANENDVGAGEKTFDDIQNLIDNANDGDVINISGTYYGNGSYITTGEHHGELDGISFTIQGKDDATLDARGLSGFLYGDGDSAITFKDIKFINSFGNSAVYNLLDSFILKNCTFINCTASDSNNLFEDAKLDCCKVINCSSPEGLFYFSTLTDCEIINCNSTESSIVYNGEATNCLFKNCLAYAAICNSDVTTVNCICTGCRENVNFEAERKVKKFTINCTGKGWINEEMIAYVYLPYGVAGTIEIWTDEDEDDEYFYVESEDISSEDNYPYMRTFIFKKLNTAHYLKYKFESYDGENDAEGSLSFPATTNYDIRIHADHDGSDLVYGKDASVTVDFPYSINDGTGAIYVNGVLYKEIDFSDDIDGPYASFEIDNINASQLTIKAVYNGDGTSGFAKKTVTKTFDVLPQIIVPTVSFKEKPKIIVNYVKTNDIIELFDINGNLLFESNLSNGQVVWELDELEYASDSLYDVFFNGHYMGLELKVGPAITLPQKMWIGDDHDFTVELPSSLIGWNVNISVGDNVLFEGVLSKTTLNLTLPNLEEGEYDIDFDAEHFNGDDWDSNHYSYDVTLFSLPRDIELGVDFPSGVGKGNDFEVGVTLPEDVSGRITLLIDGVQIASIKSSDSQTFNINKHYAEGIHNYTVIFSGDDYFHPKSVNGTFSVENYVIVVPKRIVINSNDNPEAYVEFSANTKGSLLIYVNNEECGDEDLEDNNIIELSFQDYFYDGSMSLGNNTVKLVYKDTKGKTKFTKYYNVFVDYALRFESDDEDMNFTYGEENSIKLVIPETANTKKLTILINNVAYANWHSEGWGEILINVTDLAGRFTVTAKYAGDSIYNHPVEVNKTFFSKTGIVCHESVAYKDTSDAVSLRLPGDANGKLVVTVDGNPYAAVDLIDGYAGVNFTGLSVGGHQITANYTGTDYEVEAVNFEIDVKGCILIEGLDDGEYVKYGNSFKVYLNLPSDASGRLIVNVGYEYEEVDLENGYAEITIKGSAIGVGEFDVEADFESYDWEDHYYDVDSMYYTIKIAPKFTIAKDMVVFGTNYITINTYDESIGGVFEVLCDDNGEAFAHSFKKELVDGRASISLSSLTAGEHKLVLYFEGDDGFTYSEGATINIKKAAKAKVVVYSLSMLYQDGSKFKSRIYGTDGKVLKNKVVTIYINKKKVTSVRTDSNGYAYYKVPNLPGKYNAYVTYGNVKSANAKITVKQILNFKAVFVKKSAKSLVLTASLKKVNGKYLKNKVITFKFNGKVKKAKTNSKGVAKVTYSSAFLKKLRVGKKVYYQATYVKTTIKKVATVKK